MDSSVEFKIHEDGAGFMEDGDVLDIGTLQAEGSEKVIELQRRRRRVVFRHGGHHQLRGG